MTRPTASIDALPSSSSTISEHERQTYYLIGEAMGEAMKTLLKHP